MLAGQMLLTAALARAMGLGWRDFVFADRRASWVNLVVIAFFFWPSLALCIKRLHDRDLPGWWAALLHVLMLNFYVEQAAIRPILRDNTSFILSLLPVLLLFLFGAWLVVEMAMLRGTPGDNRFGRPPADVAGAGASPSLSKAASAPRPGE